MSNVSNVSNNEVDVRSRVNQRYRTYSLLTDYFPLTLCNDAIVKGIDAECSQCKGRLAQGMFRGEVRQAPGGCFRVTAIGWCLECDLLTPYLFHIVPGKDDFELIALDFRGWPESFANTAPIEFKRVTKKKKSPIKSANTG